MSWIVESSLTRFQRFWVNVIKCGPIPRHVAIIMDGNRRYANKAKVARTQGHVKGFDKLAETLQWCLELGIIEVTVYAFSIENFKRTQQEVDTLMQMAEEKFEKLLEEKEKIMENGVCVRVLGNLGLLSEKLRKLLSEVMLLTCENNRVFLNVAFAYTSRDEITHSVNTIVKSVKDGKISVDDISEDLISQCCYTNEIPDPDILIRTSGEVRFSDYLLWQISDSYICFTDVLWPEFTIWNLLAGVFKYQRCSLDLKKEKKCRKESVRVTCCLAELKEKHVGQLRSYLV